MAILWFEGFEILATQDDLNTYYGGMVLSACNFDAGRVVGRSLTNSTSTFCETPAFTAGATFGIGFGFQCVGTATVDIIVLRDFPDTQMYVRYTDGSAANTIKIQVRQGTTTIVESGDISTVGQQWHVGEVEVTLDDTAGACELFIDDASVDSAAGVQTCVTSTNQATTLGFKASAAGLGVVSLDDLYLTDGARLGPQVIEGSQGDGAGSNTDWTPNTGTNVQATDDPDGTTNDGDATYVYSNTNGDIDTYEFADLVYITGNINAVAPIVQVRLQASGSRDLQAVHVDSSANVGNGLSETQVSTTYLAHKWFWDTQPFASAAWTLADVNDAEFGFELVP